MQLIPDARRVALMTYSFWAQVLGLFALIVPELIFYTTGRDTNPVFLWWIGVMLLLFGLIGRLVQQTGSALRNLIRIFAVAVLIVMLSFVAANAMSEVQPAPHVAVVSDDQEAIDIAVPFIASWEGKRNSAYLDVVGVPTICYGSTRGVRLGQTMTDAECLALLKSEVIEYRTGVQNYMTEEAVMHWLPAPRDAAWTSFAFNCGISAAGNSTATNRLNVGNVIGACDALTWWNKGGGRVLRGLVRRRTAERNLCMQGM